MSKFTRLDLDELQPLGTQMSTQKNEQPTQHEIDDANRHTGESCGEVSGGFICTRTPGHTGLHVASNGTEGVKSWPITPPADTTGSGREGETDDDPKHRDCFGCNKTLQLREGCEWSEDPTLNLCHDCALAKVEALRRDGELVEWVEQNKRSILRILQREHDWMIELTGARFAFGSTLRAAIDSAQRQEKP